MPYGIFSLGLAPQAELASGIAHSSQMTDQVSILTLRGS